jgi:DnaK suppressor protein
MTRQQLLRRRLVALANTLLARYEDKLPPDASETDSTADEGVQIEMWEGHRLPSLSTEDARSMNEIVDALRRVDAGSYGWCVVCGDAVGFQRLEDFPTARMCESCASDEMWRPFAVH